MSQFNLLIPKTEGSQAVDLAEYEFPRIIKNIDGERKVAFISYDEAIGCMKEHKDKYKDFDNCVGFLEKRDSSDFVVMNVEYIKKDFVKLKKEIERLLESYPQISIVTYHEFGDLETTILNSSKTIDVKMKDFKIEHVAFLDDNEKLQISR